MSKKKIAFSFLTIGKTQESTETQEFKRYMGIGSSKVLAVCPDKKTQDELMGFESQNEPEYVVDGENGKEARINFIVRTDPEACNGIEITNKLMFTLRNTPAYNKEQTKVQVIDSYGNTTWMWVEDAKAGKKPLSKDGNPLRIDGKYRMACFGEADLVNFLKVYLRVGSAFKYENGVYVKKADADDFLFSLDHIRDYFKGDFSELRDAIGMQPNNKVKLLYGVKTSDTERGPRQYQAIASREGLILPNHANANAITKLQKELSDAKNAGAYANTEFAVQELQEYEVKATNFAEPAPKTTTSSEAEMPWEV